MQVYNVFMKIPQNQYDFTLNKIEVTFFYNNNSSYKYIGYKTSNMFKIINYAKSLNRVYVHKK